MSGSYPVEAGSTPALATSYSECKSAARRPALGAGSRRFESCHSDQTLEDEPDRRAGTALKAEGAGHRMGFECSVFRQKASDN